MASLPAALAARSGHRPRSGRARLVVKLARYRRSSSQVTRSQSKRSSVLMKACASLGAVAAALRAMNQRAAAAHGASTQGRLPVRSMARSQMNVAWRRDRDPANSNRRGRAGVRAGARRHDAGRVRPPAGSTMRSERSHLVAADRRGDGQCAPAETSGVQAAAARHCRRATRPCALHWRRCERRHRPHHGDSALREWISAMVEALSIVRRITMAGCGREGLETRTARV